MASAVTTLAAVAVGLIAYRQWRTAHDKLVLDLFDRRLEVYSAVAETIDHVVANGGDRKGVAIRKLRFAFDRSHFLFQGDVRKKINELYHLLKAIYTSDEMLAKAGGDQEEIETWTNVKIDCVSQIDDLDKSAAMVRVFAPYLKMDQKVRGRQRD